MTFDEVRTVALALPGVVEGTCYGMPAFRVGGKLLCCLRQDLDALVLIDVPVEEREVMCEAEPEVYFFTDHYRDWPAVLARLPAATGEHVQGYLERSWRKRAPKKLLKGLET